SSSETSPRQVSDERISVGLKCCRAKVDLPLPDTPMSTTRQKSGMVMAVIRYHFHSTLKCIGSLSVFTVHHSTTNCPFWKWLSIYQVGAEENVLSYFGSSGRACQSSQRFPSGSAK